MLVTSVPAQTLTNADSYHYNAIAASPNSVTFNTDGIVNIISLASRLQTNTSLRYMYLILLGFYDARLPSHWTSLNSIRFMVHRTALEDWKIQDTTALPY